MRRLAFLALASALALSVVALTRGAGTSVPTDAVPVQEAGGPAPTSESPKSPELRAPFRNVFEYGASPQPGSWRPSLQARPMATPVAPASVPGPVRLIGFVARAGELKAALVIEGDVVLLSCGESATGYTLLTLDRDEGATLRTPAGSEIRAPLGP